MYNFFIKCLCSQVVSQIINKEAIIKYLTILVVDYIGKPDIIICWHIFNLIDLNYIYDRFISNWVLIYDYTISTFFSVGYTILAIYFNNIFISIIHNPGVRIMGICAIILEPNNSTYVNKYGRTWCYYWFNNYWESVVYRLVVFQIDIARRLSYNEWLYYKLLQLRVNINLSYCRIT